jgi:ankyrin repeat protein
VVQALLARSPDLNTQNKAGDTALIAASRGGYSTICHLLLTAGANKGLRNGAGVSAGDVAAGRGFAAIAKELGGKG